MFLIFLVVGFPLTGTLEGRAGLTSPNFNPGGGARMTLSFAINDSLDLTGSVGLGGPRVDYESFYNRCGFSDENCVGPLPEQDCSRGACTNVKTPFVEARLGLRFFVLRIRAHELQLVAAWQGVGYPLSGAVLEADASVSWGEHRLLYGLGGELMGALGRSYFDGFAYLNAYARLGYAYAFSDPVISRVHVLFAGGYASMRNELIPSQRYVERTSPTFVVSVGVSFGQRSSIE